MHPSTTKCSPQAKVLKVTFISIKHKKKQLESLDSLITDSKLQERLGTCRIDFKVIWSEILMDPLSAMKDKLTSKIFTF